MMFASMMLVTAAFLAIGTLVLIIIPLAIGLPLLITGIVHRERSIARGVQPPKAGVIAGSILCAIPKIVILSIVAMFTIGTAKLIIEDMQYGNVVEYWKSGSDNYSIKWSGCDIREEYLKAAENGDRNALVALYSDNAKAQPGFDEQIDEFMSSYRKGFLGMLKNGYNQNRNTRSSVKPYESAHYGEGGYSYHDILYSDGNKTYCMLFVACEYDENDIGNIGMQYVRIYSGDIAADELLTGERKPLTAASFEVNDDLPDDLRIIGNEISHTDSDSPAVDQSVALKKIAESSTIDEFTKSVGKPLAVWKSSDTSVWKINPDPDDTYENDMTDDSQSYLIVIYTPEGKIKRASSYIAIDSNRIYLSSFFSDADSSDPYPDY